MHTSHILSALGLVTGAVAKGIWATPHDKYSSSVGVLGCKINTNRVAYWPGSVDCDNICVKVSYEGRSVHLLRIDQSGGAHDISYDAWVYLQTGQSATREPLSGGSVAMEYEEVDAAACADLIHTKDGRLPLSASNSMGFVSSCLAQPDSWVAKNHVLYNICDAICTLGFDEECSLDLATSNQPDCPNTLGLTSKLTSAPVYDVEYASGRKVMAGSGKEAPADVQGDASPSEDADAKEPAEQRTTAAATSNPAATATGGIFRESSSSEAAPSAEATSSEAPSAPAPTQPPTTVLPPSSVTEEDTAVVSVATSTWAAPSHSTFIKSPVYTSPSASSTPTSSPSSIPQSAGRPAVTVSMLSVALCIAMGIMGGLF